MKDQVSHTHKITSSIILCILMSRFLATRRYNKELEKMTFNISTHIAITTVKIIV
jgi:hypothetical protein